MTLSDSNSLTAALLPAVLEAGRIEMGYFQGGFAIENKADRSPVTIADREAEAVVLAALARVAPDVTVIAEEEVAAGRVPAAANRFFLVDALDGTRLFIEGKPEFSVNIALIDDARPIFGLIYVPPTGALYVTHDDGGSYETIIAPNDSAAAASPSDVAWQRLRSRTPDPADLLAFNSRSAGSSAGPFLSELAVREARPVGSSLKFCLIARGDGDLYARIGKTYEWDTAAGQAILEAAGGSVATLDGRPLVYGKSGDGYLNPHFVAWGRQPLVLRAADAAG
ncbi:MAG: 3'(2'),5'-bisphosphate nucleotidase CysQ family protein [Hyphomicrobium sp.]